MAQAGQQKYNEPNFSEEITVFRQKSVAKFPFSSLRAPQKEMMEDAKKAIEQKQHLLADAPTGLGKTIAVLFPALQFAVQNDKTIFFLTSRLSHHRAAIDNLMLLKKHGNNFSAVDVIGKKHLCSHHVEEMDSSMFSNFCSSMIRDKKCNFYKNFRLRELETERQRLQLAIKKKCPLSSQQATELLAARFCAYEMLLDAAKSADVIVGDYFHLFGGGDKFLDRMCKALENTIIVVDEAHNLAARLRSHMSSRLTTRTCELAAREAKDFVEPEAEEWIKGIGRAVRQISERHLFGKDEAFVGKDELGDKATEIGGYDSIIKELRSVAERILQEKKISFIDRVASFLDAWRGEDYGYSRIISREHIREDDHICLQYNCLDPSLISKEIIKKSHSAILMSGTLSPMEMHRDLLGMETERTLMKSYACPFPKANRKNIIAKGITTKYTERTPENYARMATTIRLCLHTIRGNAAVFFPSYEMRNHIYELLAPVITKHVILEDSEMTKEERDSVKDELEKHAAEGAVLFGVMGGSFSEGVDLPGDLLNGVVILGLPLEKPDLSVHALIDYYDKRFGRGREYGYVYPAMIKVMQASGRCIRTEQDRGVIVFADERFTWNRYRAVFPKSWEFVVTYRPEIEVRKFFESR